MSGGERESTVWTGALCSWISFLASSFFFSGFFLECSVVVAGLCVFPFGEQRGGGGRRTVFFFSFSFLSFCLCFSLHRFGENFRISGESRFEL